MKWVTRERPKTDRIACPWLIKRFVDPDAEFLERDDVYEIKDRPDWWGSWYSRREFHDDRAAARPYLEGAKSSRCVTCPLRSGLL